MMQRKKVLVIDDDAASNALIGRALESCGLEVTAMRDARAGFETARTELPDLIFISLLLPEINGLKVSKAIHAVETLKAVPIIMILAQTGEIDPRYTAAIGIVDVLVKPFSSGEIVAKVKEVLGDDALVPGAEDGTDIPFDDEGIEPIVIDEDEETADEVLVAAEDDREMPYAIQEDERDLSGFAAAGGERNMESPETELRFKPREDVDEERDLFSAMPDRSGEGIPSSRDEREPDVSDMSDIPAGDEENISSSPVRRGVMIAASIVTGIALGVGGYLFFTAGNKQQPVHKQVTKVLPSPSAGTPATPATPGDKQGRITEIPVKQEQEDQGTAKQQQAKAQEPAAPEGKVTGKAAEEKLQPAKKAVSKPVPVPAEGQYYVQAGLFGNKDNAVALAAKIRKTGYEASVKNEEGPDRKTLYRVVAGTYTSHKKAVEMSESLGRKGIKTIVRRK